MHSLLHWEEKVTTLEVNVLVIADDDAVEQQVPEAPADILVCCGDIADFVILRVAEKCSCRHILAVKGNHDSSGKFPEPIIDLHLEAFTFRGLSFGGFCGSWKYKPKGNYLFEQDEVEQFLAAFPPVNVFVGHNSPRLIHDREDDVHLGFAAFNAYIERAKPAMFLHGHQHVNQETTMGSTKVIGTYGHRFLVIGE